MLLKPQHCVTDFCPYSKPTPDDSLGFEWEPVTNTSLAHLSLSPSPEMQGDNRTQVGRTSSTRDAEEWQRKAGTLCNYVAWE